MYHDESDPLLGSMETTEMTTVVDSRLPAQRDPEAAVEVLTAILDAHGTRSDAELSRDALLSWHTRRAGDAAAESSRRYRAGMDTAVSVEAERRWREQA